MLCHNNFIQTEIRLPFCSVVPLKQVIRTHTPDGWHVFGIAAMLVLDAHLCSDGLVISP